MIDARELMIGNWVYDGTHTQFPFYVQTIADDYVYLNFKGNEGDVWESSPAELEGIPLTDDIMKRMGFTQTYGLWRKNAGGRLIAVRCDSSFVSIEAFEDRLLDSRCTCHGVRYVHQLQNLYRMIAKKELKIDLQ